MRSQSVSSSNAIELSDTVEQSMSSCPLKRPGEEEQLDRGHNRAKLMQRQDSPSCTLHLSCKAAALQARPALSTLLSA